MESKFYSPLKIGILIVALSYFLFSLHAVLTLEWIGEWERFGGGFLFNIFVEDITGFVGMIFRFIAGLIAFAGIALYFVRKKMSKQTAMKFMRWILVFEAIYWLGLLSSAGFSVQRLVQGGLSSRLDLALATVTYNATLLIESIVIPIVLFRLAFTLNPNKPQKTAIKWGLITGTLYILLFWISNTNNWQYAIRQKGMEYLTAHPENILNFGLTTIGLLALTLFAAYFTKKSSGTETLEKLNLKVLGAIILALGMYFLWNYLTWIFFGGDPVWSSWYAWFLGHNLDLWMLSLPLVGLPLLFGNKLSKENGSQ